jgi:hypothetical protein
LGLRALLLRIEDHRVLVAQLLCSVWLQGNGKA